MGQVECNLEWMARKSEGCLYGIPFNELRAGGERKKENKQETRIARII